MLDWGWRQGHTHEMNDRMFQVTGDAYDFFMGRWSRLLAPAVAAAFASVLGVVRALATVPPGSVGTRSDWTRAPTMRHA